MLLFRFLFDLKNSSRFEQTMQQFVVLLEKFLFILFDFDFTCILIYFICCASLTSIREQLGHQ